MKSTGNLQINVKTYWDGIYSDLSKDDAYWGKTMRFYKAVDYIKDGDKVIDIGCGVGTACRLFKEKRPNAEVWGCDIAKEIMKREQAKDPNIKYVPEEVGNLKSIPSNYFDVVFAGEILEHLNDPQQLFKDAYRLLKSGGKFINTTPLGDRVKSPEHMWFFEQEDIENFYLSNGFDQVEFKKLPDMEHLYIIYSVGIKK